MSTINSKNVQVGTSSTAAQNFTWYQPASPDGTVRLGVGNSGATTGDVVTVNSSGVTVTGTLASSGVTTVPAGSAAAPSISPTGDSNTGLFFPAADTVAFSEGGAEAMRIDSSGNVGIGTSSPSVPLQVAGTIRSTGTDANAGAAATTGTATIAVISNARTWSIQSSNSNSALRFRDETSGFERAQIDSTGNLLVGFSPRAVSISGALGSAVEAHAFTSGSNMSGSSWVVLTTLTPASYTCADLIIFGAENGTVNTYSGIWRVVHSTSGWGIAGPFEEVGVGNNYSQPNLRMSGNNVEIQARNGVSSGVIRVHVRYYAQA